MPKNFSLEQLIENAKNHQDWRVRNKAIQQLGDFDAAEVLETISSALHDDSPHVVDTAASVLANYGTLAIPPLLQAFKSRNNIASPAFILHALRKIGDPSAIPAAIECLESDNQHLHYAALLLVTEIPDERALQPILSLLETVPEDGKHTIAQALGAIGSPEAVPALVPLLFSPEYVTRRFSAIALARIGNDIATQALLDASRDSNDEVRCTTAEGLGLLKDERAYKRLTELTHDSFPRARAAAAMVLAKSDSERAQPYLLKMLDDSASDVQNTLRHALGDLSNIEIIPVLVKQYRDDLMNNGQGLYQFARNRWKYPERGDKALQEALNDLKSADQNLRIAATWLLYVWAEDFGRLLLNWETEGNNREDFKESDIQIQVIETLVNLLVDKNDDVRLGALEAMIRVGDKRATTNLIQCLNHNDPLIMRKAADALATVKDEQAVQPLQDILKRDDEIVGNLTAFLKRIKRILHGQRVSRLDHITRQRIVSALGAVGGNEAFFSQIELLTNPASLTRQSAAFALGNLGDKRAVPFLIERLKRERDASVREWIVYGLGCLKDKRATQAIIDVLKDPGTHNQEARYDVRKAVMLALHQIRDEASLPALYNEANTAEEWQIRLSATDAIGVIGTPQDQAHRLFELLKHKNETVRAAAAKRLGYLGARTEDLELRDHIVANLIQRLQDAGKGYHAAPTVAHMAARSLYFVGTPEANEALRKWRSEDDENTASDD